MSENQPIPERPDNLYDGAIMLLRSWAVCFETPPIGRTEIIRNLVKDSRALLRDEEARQASSFALARSPGDLISREAAVGEAERFLDTLKDRSNDRKDGAFIAITRLAKNLRALPSIPAATTVPENKDWQYALSLALKDEYPDELLIKIIDALEPYFVPPTTVDARALVEDIDRNIARLGGLKFAAVLHTQDIISRHLVTADAGMKDSCWHCGVVLAETVLPRCEDCPAECDEENCSEMGCAPDGSGAAVTLAAEGKEK